MIHRDTSWYKGLYHWKMASACGLKAYLLYWYIMIQGSINKYSLGFFSAATHDTRFKNLKSFWVLIFRVSFVSHVSNGVQTPFVTYHMTQFVCIMMYHEQHADATNGCEAGHDNSCPRKYVSTCITHVTCWFDAGKMRWYKMIHTCGEIICPLNP